MRVIAGKYRGKKLKEFELGTTRPTLDRVKEAMFSSIQFDLINAKVLDLFSGTGALGIEAISRGANQVVFVDKNEKAIKIIKENLLNIEGNYSVNNSDYLEFLTLNRSQKFNVVLLDAPFMTDYAETAIRFIIKNDMLYENGVVVFEHSIDKKYTETFENFVIKEKKYGQVMVTFIRKSEI